MSDYEIVKGRGKTMWLVRSGEDVMRFYKKRECEAWIARAIAADKKFAEDEAAIRATRLQIAREYLSRRAARPKVVQLDLFN